MRTFYDQFLYFLQAEEGNRELLEFWEEEAVWSFRHDDPVLAVTWVSQMAVALVDYAGMQQQPGEHLRKTVATISDLLAGYITGLY